MFPFDWYWIVAGSTTQVYSSNRGIFVAPTDPVFVAWLSGRATTAIDTVQNLGQVLALAQAPRPTDAGVLAAYQAGLVNDVETAIFQILFNHENRIRALEGKIALTRQQALTALANLM